MRQEEISKTEWEKIDSCGIFFFLELRKAGMPLLRKSHNSDKHPNLALGIRKLLNFREYHKHPGKEGEARFSEASFRLPRAAREWGGRGDLMGQSFIICVNVSEYSRRSWILGEEITREFVLQELAI